MKKSLLTTLLASFCAFAFAQKGTVLLNGDISFYSTKSTSGKTSSLGIMPGIGYQIADKWTLGLNLGYGRSDFPVVSNKYSIGPYLRYTKQLSELISVYGQFQAAYGQNRFSGYPTEKYFSLNVFPAIELNLGKGFGLNFNLGGIKYEATKSEAIFSHNFSVDLASGYGFGISKRFGVKK